MGGHDDLTRTNPIEADKPLVPPFEYGAKRSGCAPCNTAPAKYMAAARSREQVGAARCCASRLGL